MVAAGWQLVEKGRLFIGFILQGFGKVVYLRMKTTITTCSLVLMISLGIRAQQTIDSLVTAGFNEAKFSGTVLVAKAGRIILLKGYGYADADTRQLNDAGTVYNIASLTKSFTGALILKLQEAGKLSVQDKLVQYFPGFPNATRITIHHLLSHTSGIPDYVRDPVFRNIDQTQPVTLDAMMAWFNNKPLEFEPGTKFRYSNSGYTMLGAIIEKVTGMHYGKALEKYILTPLGMHHTSYGPPTDEKAATGYSMYYRNFKRKAAVVHPSVSYSTGAIYSTVEDLYKWQQQPVHIEGGPYNYGWFTDTLYGRQRLSHDGNIPGYKSNINRFPQDDICVIALSNSNNSEVGAIVRNMVNVLYHQPFSGSFADQPVIKLPDSVKKEYTGVYKYGEADSATIRVHLLGHELYVAIPGQDSMHIEPVNRNVFKSGRCRIEFMRNNQGGVQNIFIFSNGAFMAAGKL